MGQYTGVTSAGDELVAFDDILAAAERLAGVIVRTPLLAFDDRAWLKPESLQPVGSFKLRGAYNALAALDVGERRAGVVTHSSGNHAQGVARAARLLGMPAVIVMPDDAPATKVAGVRADGATIVTVGPDSEERVARAHELAAEQGLYLLSSYDDRQVIAGQGTAGLEIVEQVAEVDLPGAHTARAWDAPPEGLSVVVPIGGGGLSSGVATAVKSLRPDAHVYGVEPELAADAHESLRAGHIVRWAPEQVGRTIADGQRTTALGRLNFAQLSRYLDGVLLVSETEIKRAMARAAARARLVLEPSGATSLAAWLFHADELPPEGRVVVLLSGGNVDPEPYARLVAEGRAAGG